MVEQNERLSQAIKILNESYQLTLATLVTLHNKYLRSKDVKNIFNRYALLREMIKVLPTAFAKVLNNAGLYGVKKP